jgi:mono/diheme cytochrome c family protein
MTDKLFLGLFDDLTYTGNAVAGLRDAGISDKQMQIMSNVPFSSKIFGRKTPRHFFLPFVLAGALGGALIAFFITVITPRIYPIHVGAQELTPFPPSAIMFFEFMALGMMVASFVGFLFQGRYPILRKQMYDKRIAEGLIGLQVDVDLKDAERTAQILRDNGAVDVVEAEARDYPAKRMRFWLFWGVVTPGLLTAVLIPLLFSYGIIKIPWINILHDSPAVHPQEGPRRMVPESSIPFQGPPLLVDANGDYFPSTEPFAHTPESIQRGGVLFAGICSACHGPAGNGEGPMKAYFPEIPALNQGNAQTRTPEELYVIITRGRGRMPPMAEQLTNNETWDVVNYIMSLDETAPAETEQ